MRYFLIAFVCLCFDSFGQDLIRGIVVDSATFAPLPYVSIYVKNTFRGTSADAKGNFSIQASETDTLLLTLVGYKPLQLPLIGYEPGLIRMAEQTTVLKAVIVTDSLLFDNPYEGMFDEERQRLKTRIPFYYHKTKKDRIKAANWREVSSVVQTYVDVVINDPSTKTGLMEKYELSEKAYYEILSSFNEQNHSVMYFLTRAELISFLNRYFEAHAPSRK